MICNRILRFLWKSMNLVFSMYDQRYMSYLLESGANMDGYNSLSIGYNICYSWSVGDILRATAL